MHSKVTSSVLASIFLWVKPCCSTWLGIPNNCKKDRQKKTHSLIRVHIRNRLYKDKMFTFDTQCISWLFLIAAYPRASASNLRFPKCSTLAIIPNRCCIMQDRNILLNKYRCIFKPNDKLDPLTSMSISLKSMTDRALRTVFQSLLSLMELTLAQSP